LKVHLPDFATKTKHDLDWYCKKHPSVMQFHNQSDALYHWNVDKNRELGNDTELYDVAEAGSAPEAESALSKRGFSARCQQRRPAQRERALRK
jgi:alpha-tubulin suppressor-like RCC1 family protein